MPAPPALQHSAPPKEPPAEPVPSTAFLTGAAQSNPSVPEVSASSLTSAQKISIILQYYMLRGRRKYRTK